MDKLVRVLWFQMFPERRCFGPNHKLDRFFHKMHQQPALAALQICPFYFDQVTYSLPMVTPRESKNLRLRCFNSWANPQEGKRRAAAWHSHGVTYEDERPNCGVYLNKLCQLQDVSTGGSVSSQTFLFLMYGHMA